MARCPSTGREPAQVIAELIAAAEPGVVAMPSGRYFGFVIGGALPAALAADWLTSTWDQNAGLVAAGPSAAVVEEVALAWLIELLGLPEGVSAGFVTGCQMAHVTALAAARHHVLDAAGWDLARDGLQGAPRIRVHRGRGAPRHRRPRPPLPRDRHRADRAARRGRAGADACPRRCGRRWRPARARRSSAHSPGTSTPARSTRSRRSRTRSRAPAPGCTSTAPSGSGRPLRRASGISSPGRSERTPGPPTATSG